MVDFGSLASWCEPRATPCKPGSRECGQAPRTAQRPSDPRPMAPPALCLARRRASCDTKTKPQPRRAIRARLFDLCSQRKPVTHASRSQHVRSPPVVSCMPCALCAVPCGQKRLFLKNLGRGLAGCIAFQHALCMCRECQSACLAPFLRACPIAESGLPQCVHKRVGFLGGGHCDCIAAVLHFCLVEHTHALHPQGYWTTRPVATLLSATPPCGSTSSRASSTLVAVALLYGVASRNRVFYIFSIDFPVRVETSLRRRCGNAMPKIQLRVCNANSKANAAGRIARGFDGLGREGGPWPQNEASGRPERVDPQGRLGRAGRCGRRAARVNWRFQCKSESATRPVQR